MYTDCAIPNHGSLRIKCRQHKMYNLLLCLYKAYNIKRELHPWTKNLHVLCSYLKIINTFLKNNICILKKIVQGTKKGIEILVGQADFKLAYLNSNAIFEFHGQFAMRRIIVFFQKGVDNFEIKHKTCQFLVGCSTPLILKLLHQLYVHICKGRQYI